MEASLYKIANEFAEHWRSRGPGEWFPKLNPDLCRRMSALTPEDQERVFNFALLGGGARHRTIGDERVIEIAFPCLLLLLLGIPLVQAVQEWRRKR